MVQKQKIIHWLKYHDATMQIKLIHVATDHISLKF